MTGRHHNHRIPADRLRDALDGDLIGLWLDGHREGLHELTRRHHDWLLRTVRLLSHGESDPEAIVQDVWLDVMRGARTYRGDGSVRSWLSTIVRHRITSTWHARNRRPQTLIHDVPETVSNPGQLEDRVALEDQLQGLGELPVDQRDAVWHVDVVGLPVTEAANKLGVPPGTVKSRCCRGRTKLRMLITRRI